MQVWNTVHLSSAAGQKWRSSVMETGLTAEGRSLHPSAAQRGQPSQRGSQEEGGWETHIFCPAFSSLFQTEIVPSMTSLCLKLEVVLWEKVHDAYMLSLGTVPNLTDCISPIRTNTASRAGLSPMESAFRSLCTRSAPADPCWRALRWTFWSGSECFGP